MVLSNSKAPSVYIPDTPEICPAIRVRQATAFGHLHVKITVDPKTDRELEIFAQLGHAGGMEQADLEAMCRPASLVLRSGCSLTTIIGQWMGIGTSVRRPNPEEIACLPGALSKALTRYLGLKQKFGLRKLLLGEYEVEQKLVVDGLDNRRVAGS